MANYARVLLSGSTNGMPVPVAATATPGTTIHTAVTGTTNFDEVYFWASNVTSAGANLTVEWGGTTDPTNDLVYQYNIPAYSPPIPIATGQVLNNGLLVKAWASVASSINLTGYVNRITS